MAARLQRLLVFCGIGLMLFSATVGLRMGGFWWGAAAVVLVALLYPAVLAVELAMVAVVGRQPPGASHLRETTTLARICRAWLGEIRAGVQTFCWEQPFRTDAEPDRWECGANGQRGVILVHGLFCNRAFWNRWMTRLRAWGDIPYTALTLEPLFGSIDHYAATLEAAVGRMTAATGQPPLVVAHSMGGLVVRSWLALQTDAHRIHHVITIGTPHRGTWLARFAQSLNARQMSIGSDWLQRLGAIGRPEDAGRFTCFHSDCDNVVFPHWNAALPGADNRMLPGLGHVQLADHPAILLEARRHLNQQAPARWRPRGPPKSCNLSGCPPAWRPPPATD